MPHDSASSHRPLGTHEVHVWHCATIDPADVEVLAQAERFLSAEERARAARFFFDRDRHTYLVAHALVRTRLSATTGVDPKDWTFVANKYGRPEVSTPTEHQSLRFNLSHTRGLVACALTWRRDVGVDVENLERLEGSLDVARRFFAEPEVDVLSRVAERDRRRTFFDFWTLKESYIKARGMGLSLPLRQFAFDLAHESNVSISFGPEIEDDPAHWEFHLSRPTERHRLALAVRRPPGESIRVTIREVSPLDAR
ncbi:MAG: 4'-phosphopantetheinyl transferase superfamily protein [Pirellulales bacterium]|nr:4'-phosphopantetheinyl transferase superfamily protein [Pirellulales bacterium]